MLIILTRTRLTHLVLLPAALEPIPVAPVEHVQLFKVKESHQKKWHPEPPFSNGQFPGDFVVHMLSCLHVLLRVMCPLCPLGDKGTVKLGMFPRVCEDTVVCRRLLFKGIGRYNDRHGGTGYQFCSFCGIGISLETSIIVWH